MSLIWAGTSNLEAARRCEHCACYVTHCMRCCYCDFTPYMLRRAQPSPTKEALSRVLEALNARRGHS